MRKSCAILAGWFALLAVLPASALAKSAAAQKAEDKSAAAPCSAYEQAPDGSWIALPCQEIGSDGRAQHKSAPGGADEATH